MSVDRNDHLYVCDRGSLTIKVIDNTGKLLRIIDCNCHAAGELCAKPRFVTVHKARVWVSDDGGKVHLFSKSGTYIRRLPMAEAQDARGLTVTAAHDLIIIYQQYPIRVVGGDKAVSVIGDRGQEPWRARYDLFGVAVTDTCQVIVANCFHKNLLVYDLTRKIYSK